MLEGWQTFVEHPLTGVGAGMFKNYNPPDRLEPWRETHNVLLQIGAELGVFGLLAFFLLLWQAGSIVMWARRQFLTRKASSRKKRPREPELLPVAEIFRPAEGLDAYARGGDVRGSRRMAGVCAIRVGRLLLDFYYLFALIVAGRELTGDRLAIASVAAQQAPSAPAAELARR